jgi:hypothetical protein
MPPVRPAHRPGPVVADAQPQRVGRVAQLHVNRRPGGMPPRVGQRLLHDAVGGQLDAGVERRGRPGDDQPGPRHRGLPRGVDQLAELGEPRLRLPARPRPPQPRLSRHGRGVGDVRRVLAEHAEQPPHLGQPGPRGVADLKESPRPGLRQPRRGQPPGLRLYRDHRDVVRDHVMQLAGDPRPLTPRRVRHQRVRQGLAGLAVRPGHAPGPQSDSGPGRYRHPRRQQHARHVPAPGERQHQERQGQPHGQVLRPRGTDGPAGHGPQVAGHPKSPGGEYRPDRPGDGRRGKHGEHEHVGSRRDDGRPGGPQEQQRHRRRQGERAQREGIQEGEQPGISALARVSEPERHRLPDRLTERGQREQHPGDPPRLRRAAQPRQPAFSHATHSHRVHAALASSPVSRSPVAPQGDHEPVRYHRSGTGEDRSAP